MGERLRTTLLGGVMLVGACGDSTVDWPIVAEGRLGFHGIDGGGFRVVDAAAGDESTLPVPSWSHWGWLDNGDALAIQGLEGDYAIVAAADASPLGVLVPVNRCGAAPVVTFAPSGTRVAIEWGRRCEGSPTLEVWQADGRGARWQLVGELGNGFGGEFSDVAWSLSSQALAYAEVFGSGHSRAELHQVTTGPNGPELVAIRERNIGAAFVFSRPSPQGDVVVLARGSTVWGGPQALHSIELSATVTDIVWHPAGEFYALMTADGLLWNIDRTASGADRVGFYPPGSKLVGWSVDGDLALIVPCSEGETSRVELAESSVQSSCMHRVSASWAPTSAALAVEGDDRVRLFDTRGEVVDLGPGRDAKWAPALASMGR